MDRLQHLYTLAEEASPMLHHTPPQLLGSVWERHSNLQIACMVLSIFFWFFSFTAAFCAITISRSRYSGQHKRSQSSRLPKEDAPGVSIIRPLRGIDCNMYENLASSFRQDYPRFEILFSVANTNDPAIAVVQDLMRKFPRVDARLIIGERNVGINPKINNMIRSYESAKYDILWVYDSNVYVDPGCMGRSIDKMLQPNVGLVHHLPFGVRPQTLGSDLELMFLDTVHAKMYLFINWTGLASCVVGKSSLYRRSILDKVGGLSKFGKYMAEDNLIATEIFNMGYKHEMTSDLAYQSLGSMTPSDYFLRRARWTRIRKYTVTAATIVEPFIEMIGCGLVASYGFNLLWQTHFLNFLAFHIVVWFLIDLSMYQALSGENVDNLRGFLMTWCLREVAALPLYVYAVLGSTVDWRDQTFLLQRDGTVLPLEVPTPEAGIARDDKDDHSTSSSSDPSSSRSLMGTVSVPPASPTSLAPTTTFANLANTVVPQSTQVSLRNFFRRPAVISLVSSTFAVIHFVVDILIKSQRNGNDEDDKDDLADDDIEEPFFTEGEDDEGDLETDQSGTRTKSTLLLVKRPRHLLQQRSSSGSASGCSAPKKYRAAAEENTDESQHYDTAGEQEFVPRRSERIRMRLALSSPPSSESFTPKSKSKSKSRSNSRIPVSVFSNTKSETEAEHGRRSMEEDALSIAVEPYLSDSLSRRGGIRRELSASSQFLSV